MVPLIKRLCILTTMFPESLWHQRYRCTHLSFIIYIYLFFFNRLFFTSKVHDDHMFFFFSFFKHEVIGSHLDITFFVTLKSMQLFLNSNHIEFQISFFLFLVHIRIWVRWYSPLIIPNETEKNCMTLKHILYVCL